MFNVQEYINDIVVTEGDVELTQAKEMVELSALICDDIW